MSKAIKQILVIGAVIAISMVFVIQFRPGTNVDVSGGPRCAFEISGDCVPHTDFVAAYRLAAPNVEPEVLKQWRLREIVVEGLIERWLLVEDAKRLGLTVSDDDVTHYLIKGLARFSLPASQEEDFTYRLARATGGQIAPPPQGPARRMRVTDPKTDEFDYDRYKRWVGRMSNKTLKDFREFQRAELLAARMRGLVRTRVRVSEKEAFAVFARNNEKAVVDHLKLERAFYRDHVIDRSDDVVSQWRGEHEKEVDEAWNSRKESYLPECRKARHILVRIDATNANEEEAKKKARDRIGELRARIAGGEAFAAVAREASEDQNTASKGGELGCFAAGKLAKPNTAKKVDEAVFALEEGKLSDIIETDHGAHLIKLDEIVKGDDVEKLGKQEAALDLYLRLESERLAAEGGKQILAAVQGGKSLDEALQAHFDAVLPEKAKEAFAKGKAVGGGDDPKEEGADDDSDAPLDAWTDPSRPQVATSDPFSAGAPPFAQVQNPTDATKLIFELAGPGKVPDDLIKLYDGYAVVQLKERKPVEQKTWDEERDQFMNALRRAKQRDALVAYMLRLRELYAKEVVVNIKLTDDKAEGQDGSSQ